MIAEAIAPAAGRRAGTRANSPACRVADRSGRVWAHPNPFHLYRWVAARNELLAAFEAAPAAGGPDRRRAARLGGAPTP